MNIKSIAIVASVITATTFVGGAFSAAAQQVAPSGAALDKAEEVKKAIAEAKRLGAAWMIDKPELLKLGPSAIRALSDVRLSKQTYERLRVEGQFEAIDVITFAEYIKPRMNDPDYARCNSEQKTALLWSCFVQVDERKNVQARIAEAKKRIAEEDKLSVCISI